MYSVDNNNKILFKVVTENKNFTSLNPDILEISLRNDGLSFSSSRVINFSVTRPNNTVAAQMKLASLRKPTNVCIIGSGVKESE